MHIPKWPIADNRELELLKEVLDGFCWGGFHEFVGRLEQCFADFQHCRYGITTANGTVSLEIALEAAGIKAGDEVIVPAISFISTATAVSRVGATPVFVDIEPCTFNIDPERVAAAITKATKAIMVVHFGGPLADMDRLERLSKERGLTLIEDAAHAHGSEWRGRRAGSFGLAGSFSFQDSKVMTAGEGGMLTTNDPTFAERARSLVNQGRREGEGWFYHYTLAGNNRITALQAAILLAQLERLPDQINHRTQSAALLRSELADVPGLRFQEVPPQVNAHSHYLMLGRIDARRFGITRDEFHQVLVAKGVPCTPFYPHPLYGNPVYKAGGCRVSPCPNAEACIHDAFWLPHRVLLSEEETLQEIATLVRGLQRGS